MTPRECARLQSLTVLWHDPAGCKGGQFGARIAFAPDGKSLFLSSGERQRFTPAQDPNQPLGKILHLTLDGRPAAKKDGERAARVLGMGNAAVELAEAGIIGLESRHGDRVGRVRLGVGEDEVRNALREDLESQGLGFNA